MKHQILISLFILCSGNLLSQTSVTGVVTDAGGEALAGANIYFEGTYDGTTSNREGIFMLLSSESGTQMLCIDFIGFKQYRKKITLTGGTIDLATIELDEEVNELTAVTITAGTFEAGDKKKSIALSSIDMVTTDGSSGDVYGALQALPGTTTVGESGKLFVKGGDSREAQTYIDGTLVYVPYSSSSPNTSVRGRFSPFMFSGMMFSTGGYSAEFGQALSSVLSLKTNAMEVQDQLNVSLLTVGAELGGIKTWHNASVNATMGYNNLKPYMSMVPQYKSWEKEPRSLTGDISFRLKTGKSGMLKVYATASRSTLTTVEQNLNLPSGTFRYNLLNDNQFINSSWTGEIRKDWILTAAFSYTGNLDRVRIDTTEINERLLGTHTKISLKHRISDRLNLHAGAEWFARTYSQERRPEEITLYGTYTNNSHTSNSYTNNTLAGFLEAELYASNRFVMRLGTRAEHSDYLEQSTVSPRISTAFKLGERSQVSFAYGWFFQDPDNEFLLQTSHLDYERANHYTLNFIMNRENRMLRTELYYKQYRNLVKYGLNEDFSYRFISNDGNGYAYGLDLFWRDRRSIKNGEYWISYSYIESRRDYLDYPHMAMPDFTSRHNLTLIYKQWFDLLRSQLGVNYSIASPRCYNDPNSEIFNGEKSLPYRSLDLNWSFLPRQNVIIYLSVSNLLGREQLFGYQYAALPDENGFYRSAPILPAAKRWILLGCFITLSRNGEINQLDKIN